MPPDLVTEFLEFRDAAVGRSPEETVEFFLCLVRIVHMKNESQLFLKQITSVQALVADSDLCKKCFLPIGQMFRSLSKCISRTFYFGSSGFSLMNGNRILVLQCSTAALALDASPELFEFLMSIPPGFLTKRVKSFICPLHDMEGINAAGTVREVFFNTLVDPSGTIAGYNLYGCPLLRSKPLQKLGEDLLTMPVACPYNRVGIMIHNDRDVLVPLTVARLVDPDVDKVIQPFARIRLNVFAGSGDAPANVLPVDPEVLGDNTAAEVFCHPGGSQVKALGEAGIVECPWNSSDQNTMFWTDDPLGISLDIHQNASKIEGSPGSDSTGSVIGGTVPATDRTAVRLPFCVSSTAIHYVSPMAFSIVIMVGGGYFLPTHVHEASNKTIQQQICIKI